MASDRPNSPELDGFSTRAVRAGQAPCGLTGALSVPIYQTATYRQRAVNVHQGYEYSRLGNPTRSAVECQIAELERARFGCAFASGMAAIHGACSILRSGDHLLATDQIYGGTRQLFSEILPRYGIDVSYVDMRDLAALASAMRATTRMLWVETPTNPLLSLIDIAAVAAMKRPGQVLAVDNTFCSPYVQRPIELGADLVVHSTTKYINGHGDVVGGMVVCDDAGLHAELVFHQQVVGAILGPQDAYLTLRGAKTLGIRMREHARNALAVAQWLTTRDDVTAVYYPGLESHPQHALARSQMHGFGGIVSFRIHGGGERAAAFVERTRIFHLATSLGGLESLVCVPHAMTHRALSLQARHDLGITADLLRLSVGVEETADLLRDLAEALDATQALTVVA